ncbi:MAG: hypothetical protein HC807_06465, partial [Gammaproteobacteria bacterium]|nr:hypothetical protein [Gammaproteobacteria bacterium]
MKRALLGLIGERIGRSISPAMHEAAGRALGIDVRYHLIDAHVIGFGPDALSPLLSGARLAGFTGLNVTFPFKAAVLHSLDSVEGAAGKMGAVNTVVVRGDRLIGHTPTTRVSSPAGGGRSVPATPERRRSSAPAASRGV